MPEAETPEAAAPLVVDQAVITTVAAGLETLFRSGRLHTSPEHSERFLSRL